MAELAVIRVAVNPKIDIASGLVGMPFLYQAFDDLKHLGDFLSGSGVNIGPFYIQSVHICKVLVDKFLRQFFGRDARLISAGYDFVINVSEVLHVFYFVATKFKVASDSVEDDIAHGMAEMAGGIGGYPADIHFHYIVLGSEILFSPGEGVIYLHQAFSNRATA